MISTETGHSAPAPADIPVGYLGEAEVARLLGVAIATLRSWAARRTGPPRVCVGRRPIYRETSLYAWLEGREQDFDRARRRGHARRESATIPTRPMDR